MKKELIKELFEKFEDACYDLDGLECWSARDLMHIFNYSEWRAFSGLIKRASHACANSGENINDHFVVVSKMVALGSGAQREIEDVALTRYACYLIAQNGDPAKTEIAFAQTYFAVQTRKQELIEKRLLDIDRINAREKLTKSEKKAIGYHLSKRRQPPQFCLHSLQGRSSLIWGEDNPIHERKTRSAY